MSAFNGTLIAPWGANTAIPFATGVGTQVASAPSQFAGALANMYGSYNQGYGSYNQALQGLGNSYAQNYGAFAGGVSGLANALGNTWNNAQAMNQSASAAEAARQAAVSNLGTAAMANYGNVAGQGLQAWAQNQNGYQRSLADMTGANQAAVSQLGVGRYNALAGLGKSGAAMQVGRDVSAALPGLVGGATGTPSQGGSMPSGGGSGFSMLESLRGDINNGAELNSLNSNYSSGLNSLNADQEIARNTPRTMVGDAYNALMNFNQMNLGASAAGMDQFYDNTRQSMAGNYRPGQPIPTGSLLDALAGGYTDSASRIGTVQSDLNSGWGDAKQNYTTSTAGVNDLFNRTAGTFYRSRPQMQQEQWAMEDAAAARRKQQEAKAAEERLAAHQYNLRNDPSYAAMIRALQREQSRPQPALGRWRRL